MPPSMTGFYCGGACGDFLHVTRAVIEFVSTWSWHFETRFLRSGWLVFIEWYNFRFLWSWQSFRWKKLFVICNALLDWGCMGNIFGKSGPVHWWIGLLWSLSSVIKKSHKTLRNCHGEISTGIFQNLLRVNQIYVYGQQYIHAKPTSRCLPLNTSALL